MKKRFFSLLLTLCMVLLLMPTPVCVSADDHANHCICGASHTIVGDHTDEKTYIGSWTATDSLPTESGYYYLTNNVTLSGKWEPTGDIILCLNGKTITAETNTNHIKIKPNVTFTLTDCKGSGKISYKNYSGVYIDNVNNAYGTFNMYGGSIEQSDPSQQQTGVLNYGYFNMYGGSITKNGGHGVDNRKTFTMSGGSITGNTETDGGGVYNEGTFTMSGGKIAGNTARYGGGVSNSNKGTFTMSGGEITGNTETTYGGGVSNKGTFTMSGGEITGNTATTGGGGVFNDSSASIKVSGTAKITGNMTGTNNNNLSLGTNPIITIDGSLADGASIGVTLRTPPTGSGSVDITNSNLDADYSGKFSSDDSGYKIYYENNTIKLKKICSHSGVKVDGQAPTCTAAGWKDYYHCTAGCDGYFEEQACTTPITNLSAWKTDAGKIVASGHDWTYSANGAILTASCSRKATCGVADVPLTISANTVAHTGSTYSGAFLSDASAWTAAGLTAPTIMYEGIGGTVYNSSSTAPTAAGRYKATITCGSATAAAPFSITGDPHQLKVESGENGTAGIQNTTETETNIASYTEVTLTATPNSGYKFKQWVVTGATITITNNKFIMPDGDVTVKAEFEAVTAGGTNPPVGDTNPSDGEGNNQDAGSNNTNMPSTSSPIYQIINGANSTWTAGGSEALTVRGNGEFSKFTGVKVDGNLIDPSNYTAQEGSTIIALNASYLSTLAAGTHTIEIVWTDNSASTTFTINANTSDNGSNSNTSSDGSALSSGTGKKDDVPKTGDSSPIVWLFVLAGLSGTGLLLTGKKGNKSLKIVRK